MVLLPFISHSRTSLPPILIVGTPFISASHTFLHFPSHTNSPSSKGMNFPLSSCSRFSLFDFLISSAFPFPQTYFIHFPFHLSSLRSKRLPFAFLLIVSLVRFLISTSSPFILQSKLSCVVYLRKVGNGEYNPVISLVAKQKTTQYSLYFKILSQKEVVKRKNAMLVLSHFILQNFIYYFYIRYLVATSMTRQIVVNQEIAICSKHSNIIICEWFNNNRQIIVVSTEIKIDENTSQIITSSCEQCNIQCDVCKSV